MDEDAAKAMLLDTAARADGDMNDEAGTDNNQAYVAEQLYDNMYGEEYEEIMNNAAGPDRTINQEDDVSRDAKKGLAMGGETTAL